MCSYVKKISERHRMAATNTPAILIYTTPTCPDCRALKRWLDQQNLNYEERDLTDHSIAEEAKARTGVRVAPITLVGEEVFYGTFPSQKPGLIRALGLADAR
jgi:glutaredoxin-like protein NrdH